MTRCRMNQLRCVQKSLSLFTGSVISKEYINDKNVNKALLAMKKTFGCATAIKACIK